MSIEIFCPKLVVSNIIFAFLDHLKPKIFFFGHGGWHRVPPHFEISGSTSDNHPLFIYYFIRGKGMYCWGCIWVVLVQKAQARKKKLFPTFKFVTICF